MLPIPKILLHDHLDGGLKPRTVIELAAKDNVPLPDNIATIEDVVDWFKIKPGMSMTDVFRRFDLPIALMKTKDNIARVVADAVHDYRDDGIVYAEPRFAPQQHLGPLSLDDIIEAAVEAFAASGLAGGLILCAMRQARETDALVDAAIAWQNNGVIGVDLAGPEPGEYLTPHRKAFQRARDAGLGVTLHAGEMVGPKAIAEVLDAEVATRIGHGVQVIRDCTVEDGKIIAMGPIAHALLASNILLEICVTSNRGLGFALGDHPVTALRDAGFKVSINTDNRTGRPHVLTGEYQLLADLHGWTAQDFEAMNKEAAAAAFAETP